MSFPDLGIPEPLSASLEHRGITVPFPIQAATLPDCLAGRDVCGKAPTGSGKTLAFGLGILSRLETRPRRDPRGRRHLSALVLVPTRELASQIEEAIAPLARAIDVRLTSIFGGVAYGKQLAALRHGVDLLVACPGRLTDLVERGSVDLSRVDMVVVDEADRMADMGFLPAVRRLIDMTRSPRQTMLFSATLDGPVDKLIRDYQRDPARHCVEPAAHDQGEVHHHFWRVDAHDRVAVTAEAISARGPAMVFCRTKRGADRLSDRLAHAGLSSAPIHGNRSQSQRERALAAFRAGRLDVLVATDVAARGIHVDAVPLVVHFDPPADSTDYVHRSGRTGRAGADGNVVSLIGHEQLAGVKLVQRRLGLSHTISAPDVSALLLLGDPHRRTGKAEVKGAVKRPRPAANARGGDSRRASADSQRANSFSPKTESRPARPRRSPKGRAAGSGHAAKGRTSFPRPSRESHR